MEDWGQLISFEPDTVLRPQTVDELAATLEQVHASGGRVRVPGSLHSCSEIVVSDATWEQLTDKPPAEDLGTHLVKGRSTPVRPRKIASLMEEAAS